MSLFIIFAQILFYGTHVIYLYFWLVWSIAVKIEEKCIGYWGCSRFLKPSGYGYVVDLADGQWREFRGSLWLLWKAMVGIAVVYQILKVCLKLNNQQTTAQHTAYFRILVGVVILFVQHGSHSLIVVSIILLGYFVSNLFPKHSVLHPMATWIYAVAILLFKESYRIKHIHGFHFLIPLFDQRRFGGMYSWQLPANFLVLRMVSFSLDYHWWQLSQIRDKSDSNSNSNLENESDGSVRDLHCSTARCPAAQTARTHHDHSSIIDCCPTSDTGKCPMSNLSSLFSATSSTNDCSPDGANSPSLTPSGRTFLRTDVAEDYSFVLFLSYMLYAPLYVAGPILTYDEYVRYTHVPQQKESVIYYALRWMGCLMLLELLTSHFPFFAIVQSGLLPYLSIAEIAVVFYMILKLMWLKFLVMWRFFRLWAMVDGLLPPENMTRCMSNNRSLEGFWRGWHSSYNKWLVRYIYRPCGGRASRLWSVWVIFLFVALWHDIEFKLLLWGLLNAFFLVVEIYAKHVAATSTVMQSLPASLFQMVVVLSGSTYILVLIAVNLIGYSVGVGSISVVMHKVLTYEGAQVLVVSYYFLCVGVKLMMFIEELRGEVEMPRKMKERSS